MKDKELDGCTFRPEVNSRSRAMVRDKGKNAELYQRIIPQRARHLTRVLAQEREEQFKQDCTFRPTLNETSKQMITRRKKTEFKEGTVPYAHVSKARQIAWLDECTFKPKTNEISSKMEAALIYCGQDPFERLSAQSPEKERKRMDINETINSMASLGSINSKSKDEHVRDWNEFLVRQQFYDSQRHEKMQIAEAKAMGCMKEKPTISQGSKQLLTKNGAFEEGQPDIWERMQRGKPKNQTSEEQEIAGCSFAPEINAYSKSLLPRGVEELSIGDVVKRDAKREQAQFMRMREEMKILSFKPKIDTISAATGRSKIKIVSEPETYIARYMEDKVKKEEKVQAAEKEKESKEVAKCTFRPVIHESPAFVKEHVQNIPTRNRKKNRKARALANAKPEWK